MWQPCSLNAQYGDRLIGLAMAATIRATLCRRIGDRRDGLVDPSCDAETRYYREIGAKMTSDWLASVGDDGQAIIDSYNAMSN